MEKVIDCLTVNYAKFSGRASRSEFWHFVLFAILISVILNFLGNIFDLKLTFMIIDTIFRFGILIPSIALTTRRLHDLDKSGWWQLISLIPLIGGLYLFVLFCMRGTIGANRFGDDPLQN